MRVRTRTLVLATALAAASAILTPAPAHASHSFQLWFQPPADKADAGSSKDTAQLTSDWHCSGVSGDDCSTRNCTPEYNGMRSNCSALDWNDGDDENGDGRPGERGENAYFRAYGFWDGAGATSKRVRAESVNGSSGCTTTLRVKIVDVPTANTIASLWYQHVTRPSTSADTWSITVGGNGGSFNDRFLGDMVRDGDGCWEGYHVHEDDSTASAWYAWNEDVFTGAGGSFHQVDNPNKWTRQLRWTIGCHSCS